MAVIGSEKGRAQKAALSRLVRGKEKVVEGWQPPSGIARNPEPKQFRQPQSNILRNPSLRGKEDKKKEKEDLLLSSPTFPKRMGY